MDTQTLAPRSGRKVELKPVVILVAHCCSLCLSRIYVRPYRTLVLSLSNNARQGKQQCATETSIDLLKKKFNFSHNRFSRAKYT